MESLFSQIPENCDEIFRLVASSDWAESDREFLENLWDRFHPYADRNFISHFRNQFHQRFWEMYLGVAILNQGYMLIERPQGAGPDLLVEIHHSRIWIEAVAPTDGTGVDAIPKKPELQPGKVHFFNYPEEQIQLRLINALHSKTEKFQQYIDNGIVAEADACIIAVCGGGLSYNIKGDGIPPIAKALFPIGHFAYTINVETDEVESSGYQHSPAIIKRSGGPVSKELFISEDAALISSVLYSGANYANPRAYPGRDFVHIRNPHGRVLLPDDWPRVGMDYKLEENKLIRKTLSGSG